MKGFLIALKILCMYEYLYILECTRILILYISLHSYIQCTVLTVIQTVIHTVYSTATYNAERDNPDSMRINLFVLISIWWSGRVAEEFLHLLFCELVSNFKSARAFRLFIALRVLLCDLLVLRVRLLQVSLCLPEFGLQSHNLFLKEFYSGIKIALKLRIWKHLNQKLSLILI